MNLNAWNKLPDPQKKIIDQVCSNPFRTTGGLTQKEYKAIMTEIGNTGVKFIDLPKAEADQWYNKFQDVTRAWVKDLESKGLPAARAVGIMYQECEKRNVQLVSCPDEFKKI
jgi:TRAP-type C4-dicarboxylate transport system substrate-binding protein